MPRRLRKFLGTVVILVFVLVYAVVAMALAESRVVDAPKLVQTLVYFLLGIGWVLPMLPLVRWMEGGSRA